MFTIKDHTKGGDDRSPSEASMIYQTFNKSSGLARSSAHKELAGGAADDYPNDEANEVERVACDKA